MSNQDFRIVPSIAGRALMICVGVAIALALLALRVWSTQ
jgi:cell division protein FtsI/penicillin-binding protein 2